MSEHILEQVKQKYGIERISDDVTNMALLAEGFIQKNFPEKYYFSIASPTLLRKTVDGYYVDMLRFAERRDKPFDEIFNSLSIRAAFVVKWVVKCHPLAIGAPGDIQPDERKKHLIRYLNELYALTCALSILKCDISGRTYDELFEDIKRGKFTASQLAIIFGLISGELRNG